MVGYLYYVCYLSRLIEIIVSLRLLHQCQQLLWCFVRVLHTPNVHSHEYWSWVSTLEFIYIDTFNIQSSSRRDCLWIDQNRKQLPLPAPTYIDYVMSWVQSLVENEEVFPTKSGRPPFSILLHHSDH